MMERTARIAAPGAVALFAVGAAALGEERTATTCAVTLAMVAVAVGAARVPLRSWALVAASLVQLVGFVELCDASASNAGWFGVCVLAAWCAFLAPVVPAVAFWAVATCVLLVEAVVVTDPGWVAWIAGTLFTTVACLMAQHQGVLLARLGEAQAGLAERARDEERTRVAREMHDVIGHALTVTLLHIAGARLALDDEPTVARASLAEAERQARRSLEEIRASVSLLREDGAGRDGVLPLPGGADLGELVETFRRTGAPVTWAVHGDPTSLAPGPGLAAYRIVQEALTNVARHAPGAPTDVCVEVASERTRVVVDSAGAPGTPTTTGTGLVGMRERAEALGGHLDAGPAGHGWRVEAVLPT